MKTSNFSFENKLWKLGYKVVAGVDEVGRGCFAGPVVAGCVVFPKILNTRYHIPVRIDDSKKLSPRQREKAAEWIKRNALSWGIGESSTALINRIGMGKATKAAFRKAIAAANKEVGKWKKSHIDFLLIDAFYIPYVKGLRRKNQKAIINGDEKSISIAAASIIAKVYRDNLMRKLQNSKNPKFKVYGWGRNKGYGTREHQNAIKKYGITRYHRKQFVETFLQKEI